MSRSFRARSESGVYHIMLRGINRQRIFEDDEDRVHFLRYLDKALERSGAKVYAWCMMENHVHLLLREGQEPIGNTIKRLGVGYVGYYNGKNGRVGALFQDRFRSEVVDSNEYFLTVLRYIHQNPVKAGLCARCSDWKYSSYSEYAKGSVRVDTSMLREAMSREQFVKWVEEPNKDSCLDEPAQRSARMSDENVLKKIKQMTGADGTTAFQALSKEEQAAALEALKAGGATIKQLQMLTGLSYYAIQKA